jgi:hypothetical protein
MKAGEEKCSTAFGFDVVEEREELHCTDGPGRLLEAAVHVPRGREHPRPGGREGQQDLRAGNPRRLPTIGAEDRVERAVHVGTRDQWREDHLPLQRLEADRMVEDAPRRRIVSTRRAPSLDVPPHRVADRSRVFGRERAVEADDTTVVELIAQVAVEHAPVSTARGIADRPISVPRCVRRGCGA